jgi:hypothetical protein
VAQDELANGIDELRELARGIHPAVLTDHGLGPALKALVNRAPVRVEVSELPGERLAGPVEAAAYYVVAEAITNVAKHARASHVTVSVRRSFECATVTVLDDGVGGADAALGTRLRGLADRLEALDGRLYVDSPPERGTRITAEIPAPRSPAIAEGPSRNGGSGRPPEPGERRASKPETLRLLSNHFGIPLRPLQHAVEQDRGFEVESPCNNTVKGFGAVVDARRAPIIRLPHQAADVRQGPR